MPDRTSQNDDRAADAEVCPSIPRRIIEAFVGKLDLEEVIREIANATLAEFGADRVWLLTPASLEAERASVALEVTRPGYPGAFESDQSVPLQGSREVIRRALAAGRPLASDETTGDLDPDLCARYGIRSQLVQILHLPGEEAWAFGMHQCEYRRVWSGQEQELFAEIGRLAAASLSNALAYRSATAEAAKLRAVVDQVPDAAAFYGPDGTLERINAAGQRDRAVLFISGVGEAAYWTTDGRPVGTGDLPPARAIRGEEVRGDYIMRDARAGEDRILSVSARPVHGSSGGIIGCVVLSRDVTEERKKEEREFRRRRRGDALARLSVDLITSESTEKELGAAARLIGEIGGANVQIHLYDAAADELTLAGAHFTTPAGERFRQHLLAHPLHSGEGLAGAAFQIGRPLLFSEIRGDAVVEFARSPEEREIVAALDEQTLIACPIESRGERVGALVIASADRRTRYDAEDLGFAQSLAARIGAAHHIHRLHRISQEGHRAAEELARREVEARARFEAVLDSAPVGIAVVSPDELRFELANPPFQKYAARFGRMSADTKLTGHRVADVLPDLEQTLREVAEKQETRIDEALEITYGRNTWHMNQIVSPVVGRFSGQTQSLTILMQDVSEQALANSEIEALAKLMEERSARLDSILGSMTDALLVYDAGGNVVDVNSAALSMFGLGSRSEAVARGSLTDFDLRYPDGTPIPPEEMPHRLALRGEVVPDFLVVARQLISGRDLDLSIAAAPIESGGIVGAVLVARDLTALQELDRKKDEFLSVASHELRTPLTTIKGYTQLLIQNPALEAGERSVFLNAVLGEIDRMIGLISDLLDVSRIETNRLQIHPRPVRWLEFLADQAAKFRVQNAGRPLQFEADTEEVIVDVDQDRMRQVIDNLLSNAVKYSTEEMPIELRVSVVEGRVETTVIDHGIGIPKDELPRLFERFHRARNVSSRYYGGLGLGLYIAKAIVEAHGGTISAESAEGEGSRFVLSLPRRE